MDDKTTTDAPVQEDVPTEPAVSPPPEEGQPGIYPKVQAEVPTQPDVSPPSAEEQPEVQEDVPTEPAVSPLTEQGQPGLYPTLNGDGGSASTPSPAPTPAPEPAPAPAITTEIVIDPPQVPTDPQWQKEDGTVHSNNKRDKWDNPVQGLLVALGFVLGYSTIWRFPYLCYRYGGAAFLIPYLFYLLLLGIPLYLLLVFIGQNAGSGVLTCWGFARAFKGVGIAMVAVSAMVALYYNLLLTYSLHYLGSSFKSPLPWSSCDNEYNTPSCMVRRIDYISDWDCTDRGLNITDDGYCYDGDSLIGTSHIFISPAKEYYWRNLLKSHHTGIPPGIGPVVWDLALCLLTCWTFVAVCLIKGVRSYGKVAYVIVPLPLLLLFIIGIRGFTLPGSSEGIKYYMVPGAGFIFSYQVWAEAAKHVFFSLGLSYGGLVTIGSYNQHKLDLVRDTILVTLGNTVVSFFAGFVVFSYIGFLSSEKSVAIYDVVSSGPPLVFEVLAEAFSLIPVPNLWAIFFYAMMLMFGLSSQCILVETINTAFKDQWPMLRRWDWVLSLVSCGLFFLLGLLFCTPRGSGIFQWMDDHFATLNIFVITICCVVAVLVYGPLKFRDDVAIMTGNKWCLCIPWIGCAPWILVFITVPIFSLWLLIDSIVNYNRFYPIVLTVVAYLLVVASLVAIPLVPILLFSFSTPLRGSLSKRVSSLFRPTPEWIRIHGNHKPDLYAQTPAAWAKPVNYNPPPPTNNTVDQKNRAFDGELV